MGYQSAEHTFKLDVRRSSSSQHPSSLVSQQPAPLQALLLTIPLLHCTTAFVALRV